MTTIAEIGPAHARKVTAVDTHIGERLREARLFRRASMEEIGIRLAVTHQQVHKYETGVNRIAAGQLYHVAQALQLPPAWFFEGLAATAAGELPPPLDDAQRKLLNDFDLIEPNDVRAALTIFVRALGRALTRAEIAEAALKAGTS